MILQGANHDNSSLMNPTVIKSLDHIIKVNQRVAQSVGQMYLTYLQTIFQDLINVYKLYSQCISNSVRGQGQESLIKPMKQVRRDILKLIQTYIEKETNFQFFNMNFLPTLQELMLDYMNSEPLARDPETLMLFATILKKDGHNLAQFLDSILVSLCQSTLNMIANDFTEFPEFREGFFKLVHNIITHCNQGMLQLGPDQFSTIIETAIFGCKHEKPEVMEISLKSIWDLNDNIQSVPQVCQIFYTQFYTNLMQQLIAIMTDCRHLSGFKLQVKILQQMIMVIENNSLTQPINDNNGQLHQFSSNKEYVQNLILNIIMELFPNLNKVLVQTLVMQMFNNVDNWKEFKSTIRDLMVQMRSFSSTSDEFYQHEMKVSIDLFS
jgi:exportin-1